MWQNIAVLGLLLAVIMAIASLITPRAALFCKKKTRLRGFLGWLGIGLVFILGLGMVVGPQPEAPATDAPAATQAPAADTAPDVATESEIAGRPLAVKKVSVENKGDTATIILVPAGSQAAATQADLAATVMAAARQFQVELGVDAVDVRLICQKASSSFGELQLARAWYRPSREGWRDLSAAPRGFSDQELEYLRLWAELRGRFQTADGLTDEPRLKAAIAKRMGIKDGSLTPHLNLREPVQPVRVEGALEVRQ